MERRLIRWWGKINNNSGILRNSTDGGEGASGTVTVKTNDGISFGRVDVNDPRILSGDLIKIGAKSGRTNAIDINGNSVGRVSINDPRFVSGELMHQGKGMNATMDHCGNKLGLISIDDDRFISGEILTILTKEVFAKHIDSDELFLVDVGDVRFKNNTIVFVPLSRIDSIKNKRIFRKYGCIRQSNREKISIICPHCNFISGKTNMTRYHFDNCDKRQL